MIQKIQKKDEELEEKETELEKACTVIDELRGRLIELGEEDLGESSEEE